MRVNRNRPILYLIYLTVILIAPATLQADWNGQVISERPQGRAEEAGWGDAYGEMFLG